jgi:hypothetical protein
MLTPRTAAESLAHGCLFADEYLVSTVAWRGRAVAAQGRAVIARYGSRTILMLHEASRNATG